MYLVLSLEFLILPLMNKLFSDVKPKKNTHAINIFQLYFDILIFTVIKLTTSQLLQLILFLFAGLQPPSFGSSAWTWRQSGFLRSHLKRFISIFYEKTLQTIHVFLYNLFILLKKSEKQKNFSGLRLRFLYFEVLRRKRLRNVPTSQAVRAVRGADRRHSAVMAGRDRVVQLLRQLERAA